LVKLIFIAGCVRLLQNLELLFDAVGKRFIGAPIQELAAISRVFEFFIKFLGHFPITKVVHQSLCHSSDRLLSPSNRLRPLADFEHNIGYNLVDWGGPIGLQARCK
jgi:hypothetical protein